jgi:Lysylphosphatidylglycerol synthase TM region
MIRESIDRRTLLLGAGGLVAVLAVAFSPQLLQDEVAAAVVGLEDANPAWLWLAALAFLGALVCSASAWRAATGLDDRADAIARYGVGSLVNSLVPAHAGDAVRVALFARAAQDKRLLTAGKAVVGVGAARLLITGLLLLAMLFPWVLLALLAVPLLGRVARWVAAATAARLLAAAAIAAALGLPSPLLAALLILPAIDLAGLLPLTPGNIGLKSGAIALALQAHGVDGTTALSTGIALHAVETVVGLAFGSASVLYLAQVPVPRWAVAGATAVLAAAVGVSVGVTSL